MAGPNDSADVNQLLAQLLERVQKKKKQSANYSSTFNKKRTEKVNLQAKLASERPPPANEIFESRRVDENVPEPRESPIRVAPVTPENAPLDDFLAELQIDGSPTEVKRATQALTRKKLYSLGVTVDIAKGCQKYFAAEAQRTADPKLGLLRAEFFSRAIVLLQGFVDHGR